MNLSPHIDNKGKDILILGKGPTQGLGENSLTAEKMYSINFSRGEKKCFSWTNNFIRFYKCKFSIELYFNEKSRM